MRVNAIAPGVGNYFVVVRTWWMGQGIFCVCECQGVGKVSALEGSKDQAPITFILKYFTQLFLRNTKYNFGLIIKTARCVLNKVTEHR